MKTSHLITAAAATLICATGNASAADANLLPGVWACVVDDRSDMDSKVLMDYQQNGNWMSQWVMTLYPDGVEIVIYLDTKGSWSLDDTTLTTNVDTTSLRYARYDSVDLNDEQLEAVRTDIAMEPFSGTSMIQILSKSEMVFTEDEGTVVSCKR